MNVLLLFSVGSHVTNYYDDITQLLRSALQLRC